MRPVAFSFLLLNAVVFGMWIYLGDSPFMVENFLVSSDALTAGRWWTLLTSEFSHFMLLHFFVNMYVLSTFGDIVERIIGSWRFFVFYVIAAIAASLSHAGVSDLVLHRPDLPALGASGAISGVVLLFSLMVPRAQVFLLGLIPMPAIFAALLFVGLDVVGLIAQSEGGGLPIGHGAHLGGAAVGALYFLLARPRLEAVLPRQPQPVNYGDVATWRRLIAEADARERVKR